MNPVSIKDAKKEWRFVLIQGFQNSFFAPMNKIFAITGLNLDEQG